MIPNTAKERVLVALLISLMGVFYFATLREGYIWGDDFALYILHARNIAQGMPYAETGYIYDPQSYAIGPVTYPPVFPLLLAPVYKSFGLNLNAMKYEMILISLACLGVFAVALRDSLPLPYRLSMLVLIGMNPVMWRYKDRIVSDMPALLFTYLALASVDRFWEAPKEGRAQYGRAILAGLLIYLAYGTRSVSALLIPSLFLYEALRFRRISRFTLIATLTFGCAMAMQNAFLHSDTMYAALIAPHRATGHEEVSFFSYAVHTWVKPVPQHILLAAKNLSRFLDNRYNQVFRAGLLALVSALAGFGFLIRIKKRITIYELFLVLYLIAILVLPIEAESRYLVPVFPLCVFYCMIGLEKTDQSSRWGRGKYGLALIVSLMCISYLGNYTKTDFGPIRESIGKAETLQLFEFIKHNTSEGDVIIFRRPRMMALFANRRSSAYHLPRSDAELWGYFRGIQAAYVVAGPPGLDEAFWRPFLERYKSNLRVVFSNSDFAVFKILAWPSESGNSPALSPQQPIGHKDFRLKERRANLSAIGCMF